MLCSTSINLYNHADDKNDPHPLIRPEMKKNGLYFCGLHIVEKLGFGNLFSSHSGGRAAPELSSRETSHRMIPEHFLSSNR